MQISESEYLFIYNNIWKLISIYNLYAVFIGPYLLYNPDRQTTNKQTNNKQTNKQTNKHND